MIDNESPKLDEAKKIRFLMSNLKGLQKSMQNRKIHYNSMTSWNRNSSEGYNDGIDVCINVLVAKQKRLTAKLKKYNYENNRDHSKECIIGVEKN